MSSRSHGLAGDRFADRRSKSKIEMMNRHRIQRGHFLSNDFVKDSPFSTQTVNDLAV